MTVAAKGPAIAKAWGVIKKLSASEKARLLAESRDKARMDEKARTKDAVLEARLEIARNALRKKKPVNEIAEITELSEAEIAKLKETL